MIKNIKNSFQDKTRKLNFFYKLLGPLRKMFLKIKEKFSSKMKLFSFIYRLLGPLKKRLWCCVALFIFQAAWEIMIFTSLATFFQSFITGSNIAGGTFPPDSYFGYIFGIFQKIPPEKRVLIGFIFVAFSVFMQSLIKMGIMIYKTKFSTLFIWQVRTEVFSKTLRNSMSFFDNKQKGVLIQMIVNETRACYSVLKSALELLINIFMIMVYAFFMVMLSLKLSMVVFFACAILFCVVHFLSKTIRRRSSIVVEKTRKLTVVTEEAVGGIKQVKLLDYYGQAGGDFSKACWEADSANRISALIVSSQTVLTNLMGLLILSVLLYANWHGSILGVASFLTYLYIIKSLVAVLTSFNQKYGFLNKNLPAMEKVIDAFDQLKKYREESGNFIKDRLLEDKISFRGVSLDYGKGDVLENISIDIRKGQNVAIVGESGSGKTSLANLLGKLYEINKGVILIDGRNMKEYNLDFLRSKIGFVNQDTIIFNKTIKDNILMARPQASFEEVIEASKNAFAHDFIMAFPNGYDTVVGDRGMKISGGQRQRINVAQIFLKNAELLIFDEATSALDAKSEKYIQTALKKLGENRTTITIAHRLSTVRDADMIIVLDKGEVIEYGSWTSLLEKQKAFYTMLQQQSIAL